MAEYPTKHGDVPKSQWRIGFSNRTFKRIIKAKPK